MDRHTVTYYKVQFQYSRQSEWRDCIDTRQLLSQARYSIEEYRKTNQQGIKFKIIKVTEEDIE